MKEVNIVINDREYILGSNGVFVDAQGDLCGLVSSDIVKQAGLETDTETFVDQLKPEVSKRVQIIAEEKDCVIAAGIAIGIAGGMAAAVYESGILDRLP